MSGFKITQCYPHSPAKVWRALTDPDLIPRWTAIGRSGRPIGFSTVAGTRFQFVGKPTIGWNGVVDCEMLEAQEPSLLRFTWGSGENGDLTMVECRLRPHNNGTCLIWEHHGFKGLGGLILSTILSSVRRKMLSKGLPPVLAELDLDGASRAH